MTTQLHQTYRAGRRPARSLRRPISVCHVSLTLATGGLERLLAELAAHHDQTEFELEFVAISETGRFAEVISNRGCRVHTLSARSRRGRVIEMRRLFQRANYDVVHTHNIYPHLYGTLAARLAQVPVVVNTRHGQRFGQGRKSRWLFWATSQWANRIVSVSDDSAQLCVQADGIAPEKVVRIWNGIDTQQFAYAGPVDEPVGIAVARLSPEKDFETLLRAFALARAAAPALRLRIVGDGPLRGSLETLSNHLGLSGRVEFLGARSDVAAQLAQSSFFVTASKSEGLSLTLLEAMAVGLPVVATHVGGNPEVVQPNRTGLLVAPGDPESLSDALIEVCRDRHRGRSWGQAGRERVTQRFDVRRMTADYEALYRQICRPDGAV